MHKKPPLTQFDIVWHDYGHEPRYPSNPQYPNGIHIDLTRGTIDTCFVELAYPARRCGGYDIFCNKCGHRTAVTTAGRRDDPRSVKIPCKGA